MISWKDKIQFLEIQSCKNEDFPLDVPFSPEEVSGAVNRLKKRKAPGTDGVMAENLKAGGDVVITWLMKIISVCACMPCRKHLTLFISSVVREAV